MEPEQVSPRAPKIYYAARFFVICFWVFFVIDSSRQFVRFEIFSTFLNSFLFIPLRLLISIVGFISMFICGGYNLRSLLKDRDNVDPMHIMGVIFSSIFASIFIFYYVIKSAAVFLGY